MDFDPQPFSTRLKVATLAILILLFLLVAPAKWFGIGKQSYQKNELSSLQTDLVVQNINEDTDRDGIPNWKESLLGSNPSVKNKVPVSVDTSIPTSEEDRKATTRLEDPKNLTSQFIKNTVGLTTYLNEQGVTDEVTLTQVSNNIVDEAKKLDEAQIYTRKDLKVSGDEKLTTIKIYGNTVGLILFEMYNTLDILNIKKPLESFVSTKDSRKLLEYKPMAVFLGSILKKLMVLSVPNSAVESHLYLINAVETFRVTLLGLAEAENDPMRGLMAVNSYKDSYVAFMKSTYVLANYFSERGAIFTSKEGGSIFTQVILNK